MNAYPGDKRARHELLQKGCEYFVLHLTKKWLTSTQLHWREKIREVLHGNNSLTRSEDLAGVSEPHFYQAIQRQQKSQCIGSWDLSSSFKKKGIWKRIYSYFSLSIDASPFLHTEGWKEGGEEKREAA